MVLGADGNLWVTQEDGARLARITPGGVITNFDLQAGTRPNRILAGPDGHLWFSTADRIGRMSTAGVAATYPLPPGSRPRGLATGADGALRIAGEEPGVLFRLPVDLAPFVANVSATAALGGVVTLNAEIDARGVRTTFVVDYGPTAAYGSTSEVSEAGAADSPAGHTATVRGLAPGTYHLRVRASNAFGERVGEDQVVVVPAPPPGPPPDADGDGVPDGTDCAPQDAGRSQLLPEIPGNPKDEDCDSIAQPFPKVGASITFDYKIDRRGVRFTTFKATSVPAGGTVRLTCKAPKSRRRGCPFRSFSRTYPRGKRSVSLVRRFKGRRLPLGTRLDMRVLASGQLGIVRRYRVTRKGLRRTLDACVAPGARKPVACPI